MMGEVLSIAEIEAKFDSEWVLIEDPRTTKPWKCTAELYAGTPRTAMRSTAGQLRSVPSDLPLCTQVGCLKTRRSIPVKQAPLGVVASETLHRPD
jgi:hypothetical protein